MENVVFIRRAQRSQAYIAARLANKLWDEDPDREEEMAEIIESADSDVLLAFCGEQAVGFAQVGLRHDYVEGKESDGPVGYLEGVYVEEAFRRGGVARRLVQAAEYWARERKCAQFASDCELHNEDSIRFHLGSGFEEAGRIVCFIKNL
uniref:Type 1 aminoglycoside N(6')-acetyltransferase n=1 Tax=uncultured bacterium DCM003Kan07 TaxID=1471926 RepID=X2KYN4_9BACT|nr:type 1 aminoglycoside N(6')-acetyltransferase [uncultured bacterium DCM003Kan07]